MSQRTVRAASPRRRRPPYPPVSSPPRCRRKSPPSDSRPFCSCTRTRTRTQTRAPPWPTRRGIAPAPTCPLTQSVRSPTRSRDVVVHVVDDDSTRINARKKCKKRKPVEAYRSTFYVVSRVPLVRLVRRVQRKSMMGPSSLDESSSFVFRWVTRSVGRRTTLCKRSRACALFFVRRARFRTRPRASSSESSSVWRARVGVDRPELSSRKFPNHSLCARFSTWTLHLMYVLLLYLILVPSEETKMDTSVKVVKTVLLNMTHYVPYVYKYESVKASYG